MDRLKVAYGRNMLQPRRQYPLPVGLDTQKPRKINEEDQGSERTLRTPVIPYLMDSIKQMGNRFAFLYHGSRLHSGRLSEGNHGSSSGPPSLHGGS